MEDSFLILKSLILCSLKFYDEEQKKRKKNGYEKLDII